MQTRTKLEPWKAHARRLRGAGRTEYEVAAFLTEFYGREFSRNTVRRWVNGVRPVAALSSAKPENSGNESRAGNEVVTGAARDHRDDDAERWLSRNDPSYAESRRQWQQCRTDAIARQSDCGTEPKADTSDEHE
jgi:hypothetical protein